MSVRAIGRPIRLMVGKENGGRTPKMLLTRMTMNSEKSSGTNRRNSLLPMRSRAMPLRTSP